MQQKYTRRILKRGDCPPVVIKLGIGKVEFPPRWIMLTKSMKQLIRNLHRNEMPLNFYRILKRAFRMFRARCNDFPSQIAWRQFDVLSTADSEKRRAPAAAGSARSLSSHCSVRFVVRIYLLWSVSIVRHEPRAGTLTVGTIRSESVSRLTQTYMIVFTQHL